MSYQEKKSVTNIISSIVITTIYGLIMYQRYLNGSMDTSNIIKFWAVVLLIFIPISIIARIIIMIVFHVIEAIIQTAKGEEPDAEMDVTDERDKLIQLKSTTISMYIFSIGFILALGTQLFDVSNHVFFIVLLAMGFLADIVSESLMIKYYRSGV